MEETTLLAALRDIRVIHKAFEMVEVLTGDAEALETQALHVSDARENLLKHLNACVSQFPEELDELFKRSAMLLISPGVRRGFIDSLIRVSVFCQVARSNGTDNPDRDLYTYTFSRDIDNFTFSQMCGEQMFALFVADILENASNNVNYIKRIDFDRNVAEKVIALLYALKVAIRVRDAGDWPEAAHDFPPSDDPRPDGGGFEPGPSGGSGVPRVPLTPELVGGAESEIPLPDAKEVELIGARM